MTLNYRRTIWVAAVLVATAFLFAGGCAKKPTPITGEYARKHISPDMHNLALTVEMRENRKARADDTILRQLNDDVDMIWFQDRPLRLTRYPVR